MSEKSEKSEKGDWNSFVNRLSNYSSSGFPDAELSPVPPPPNYPQMTQTSIPPVPTISPPGVFKYKLSRSMSVYSKNDVDMVQEWNPAAPLTQKYSGDELVDLSDKRYCGNRISKRTMIIAIVLAFILILLVILGASIPAIAKSAASSAVAGTSLGFDSLSVTNFGTDTITMLVNGSITNPGSIGGSFDPFTLLLSIETSQVSGNGDGNAAGDNVVGSMSMPSLGVSADATTTFLANVTLTVTNMTNFLLFAHAILYDASFTVRLTGSANLEADGVTIPNVPFDKYLTLPGMNGFDHVTVLSFDLSHSNNNQVIFILDTVINNPSTVSLSLGPCVNFDAFHDGNHVGTANLTNGDIQPGNNYITMVGILDPRDIDNIISLFNLYITGNVMAVTASIATDSGITSPLLSAALATWSMVVSVPGMQTPLVKSITFPAFGLEPIGVTDTLRFTADVIIDVFNPLGNAVTMTIYELSMEMSLVNSLGGTLAQSSIPLTSVTTLTNIGNPIITLQVDIILDLSDTTMKTNFEDFINNFVTSESVQLTVSGTVNSHLYIAPLGDLNLEGVAVNVPTNLIAMNGLSANKLLGFDLSQSNKTTINAIVDVELINPSVATVSVGEITFDVYYLNEYLGQISNYNMTFFPTTNDVDLIGVINPTTPAGLTAASKFFSLFISGQTFTCQAYASANALQNPIFNAGFQGFVMNTMVQGSKKSLVSAIEVLSLSLNISSDTVAGISLTVYIELNSPLGPHALLITESIDLGTAVLSDETGAEIGTLVVASTVVLNTTSTTVTASITGDLEIYHSRRRSLASLVNSFINSNEVVMNMDGVGKIDIDTSIGLMELTNIPISSNATADGIGGLKEATILSMNFLDTTTTTIVVSIQVLLNNPTQTSAILGDVYFDVYYEGAFMGNMIAADLQLNPGSNVIHMTGDITPSPNNIAETESLMSCYLGGRAAVVTATAANPASPLSIVSDAMQGLNISALLPSGSGVDIITSMSFTSLSMNPIDNTHLHLAADVVVDITSPLGDDGLLLFQTLTLSANLLSSAGNVFGTITNTPVTVIDSNSTTIICTIVDTVLIVDDVSFGTFMQAFIAEDTVELTVEGVADCTVETSLGLLSLTGIAVTSPVLIQGMDGQHSFTITSDTLINSNSTNIIVDITGNLDNPSSATVTLGTVEFNIYYQGIPVGTVIAPSVTLNPGNTNLLSMSGIISVLPANLGAANGLFQNYISGISTPVTATASSTASSNPYINQGLQGFTLSTSFPGSDATTLITGVSFSAMSLSPDSGNLGLALFSSNTTITINSPLGPNGLLTMKTISLTTALIYNGNNVGTFTNYPASTYVSSNSNAQTVYSYLSGQIALYGTGANMASFVENFINNEGTISIQLIGSANVEVLTSIGTLALYNISIDQPVSLQAIGGLPAVTVSSLDLPSNVNNAAMFAGTYDGINLDVSASLTLSSIASVNFGSVNMEVIFEGSDQAILAVNPLQLHPGSNIISAIGVLNPASSQLGFTGEFFTSYVAGSSIPVTMTLSPTSPSTTPQWIQTVLASLSLTSTISAGKQLDLIGAISLSGQLDAVLLSSTSNTLSGTAVTTFTNPFEFEITVLTYTMVMTISQVFSSTSSSIIGQVNVPDRKSVV